MKRILPLAGLAVVFVNGCASSPNTANGAVTGGVLGAVAGTIVGAAFHRPALGAAIGGGTGAVAGGLAGHHADVAQRKAAEAQAAAAMQQGPLGLTDIAQMAQQHLSDAVIIGQIRSTGSIYHLSPAEISWLKESNVSDAVILEMQSTANRYPPRVYSAVPVYGPPPVIVAEPAPVSVGVGIGYRGGR
jgi:hypothetical protein